MNYEKPLEVTRAVQLLYVSFVIGLVNAIATIIFNGSGKTLLAALIILVPSFALAGLFVYKISQGKNWARIIFLILILVGIPFAVSNLIKQFQANIISGIFVIVVYVLQYVAMYLLFKRNSNIWFKSFNQDEEVKTSTSTLTLD